MGLLTEVRAQAASITAIARWVRIKRERVTEYAASLPVTQALDPELDPATHYRGEPAATLAYVVTLDAINFGSGYFPWLRKREGMSGYFTVASRLKDRFEALGPFSAKALQAVAAADCARIFGQTANPEPAAHELMSLFAQALNDLGRYLETRYGGSCARLVEAANGSAERLAVLLAEMPFYKDVGFYKRAQLTAADLSLAGVAHFRDLDRLTIFADNLVPHVLRVDGLLEYEPGLLARINREELIAAGSPEEREIRASALHAAELISEVLRDRYPPVTAMQLDYVLWNRGQAAAYKAQPRHRTQTVFY
jgi:hypothetical protein